MKQEQELMENGLPKEVFLSIDAKFKEYEDIANEWNEKAYQIVVTDESQVDLMQKAKEGRILLRDKRKEIEKTRVRLKEQSLLEGRFIDSLAKRLKQIIEPAEKHLELQEKYAEIKEKLRKDKLKNDRLELLNPYLQFADLTSFDLSTMSDVAFKTILSGCKVSYENHQKEQEEIRIEQEKEILKNKTFTQRQSKITPYFFYAQKGDKFLTKESSEEEFLEILNILETRKKEDDNRKELLLKQNSELQKKVVKAENKVEKETQKTVNLQNIVKTNIQELSELDVLKKEHANMKVTLESCLVFIIPDNLRKSIEQTLNSLKK
jgi:hypothetical protein